MKIIRVKPGQPFRRCLCKLNQLFQQPAAMPYHFILSMFSNKVRTKMTSSLKAIVLRDAII